LDQSDFVVVALSRSAVRRPWVQREIDAAFARETKSGKKVLLPALLESIRVPTLLDGKLYADFSGSFKHGIEALLTAIVRDPTPHERPLFEVVESHILVDILRKDGSLARHVKSQRIRSLFDGAQELRESFSTEGELTDFRTSPGSIVERASESVSYHIT